MPRDASKVRCCSILWSFLCISRRKVLSLHRVIGNTNNRETSNIAQSLKSNRNMSKKSLWRLQTIVMAAMLSVGFTSCCCDKDDVLPSTTGDGLEGYWLEDLYKTKTETTNNPESPTAETVVFDDSNPCNLIYLDGQGGGTYYYTICTEERRNVTEEYQERFTNKVGAFTDYQTNTHTYYGYKQDALVYFMRGTTLVIAVSNSNNSTNTGDASNPLDDILANPNIPLSEIFGNSNATLNDLVGSSGAILKNVVDGGIYGYHRATKVQ